MKVTTGARFFISFGPWGKAARGEDSEMFLYLLSCRGPSPLRTTQCHRLRRAMSHSRSFDFPELGP